MKSFIQYLKEVEEWQDQVVTNDETGKQYKVGDIYRFAQSNPDFFVPELPIKHTDGLEWWHRQYDMNNPEHRERMEKADTSVPVLGIRGKDGNISIADGLNRIKKAHSIEDRTTIPAYVIDEDDLQKGILTK